MSPKGEGSPHCREHTSPTQRRPWPSVTGRGPHANPSSVPSSPPTPRDCPPRAVQLEYNSAADSNLVTLVNILYEIVKSVLKTMDLSASLSYRRDYSLTRMAIPLPWPSVC
ncbi:Ras Gtpase-Activating Protein 1 [Manis pentadactyla]|nr:Ras Gtpase-Activating Protein 1 [Manis pentadactyla]